MGFEYTDAVFTIKATEFDVDGKTVKYSRVDHAVLGALAQRANEKHGGKCWPGYSQIAEDSHFSYAAIRRSLSNLEALGFITMAENPDKQGNIYTIQLDRIKEVADKRNKRKPRGRKIDDSITFKGKTYTHTPPAEPTLNKEEFDFLDESVSPKTSPVSGEKTTTVLAAPHHR